MKKIRLLTLLALIPMFANAYDALIDGVYYNLLGDEAIVTYNDSDDGAYSGSLNIPQSVTYNNHTYSVTCIGKNAFYGDTGLTSVIIPNSVVSISDNAFYYTGLTSVDIPNSVTDIGNGAFANCRKLTSITISSNIKYIAPSLFAGCSKLSSITIPSSVTSIGDAAFSGCSVLTSITVPNKLTSIGNSVFKGCSQLATFTIPESVTEIGGSTFQNCTSLTSVTIPNSVTSIGSAAFSGCSGMNSIIIPNSVTSIGDAAFSGCSRLEQIEIPISIISVGNAAFAETPWLRNQSDGLVYVGRVAYKWKGHVPTQITIREGTKEIASYAFNDCSNMVSIIIPDSVAVIRNNAFAGCTGLTSITIGSGLKKVESLAFKGCSSITSLNLDCKHISGWFAESKSQLQSLILGNHVESIGNKAFQDHTNLVTLSFSEGVTTIGEQAFSGCLGLTNLIIPNSTTEIQKNCFEKCSGLTSVFIGRGIVNIREFAFSGCSNITSLNVDCEKVGSWFSACKSNVQSLILGKNVKTIGDEAFQSFTGLTTINFSDSLTTIGRRAFCGCSGLSSLVIPNSVTSIGESAFSGCQSLTSISIGRGLTAASSPFSGCSNVTSLNLDCDSIGQWFYDIDYQITSLELGEHVKSIGKSAFHGFKSLTSIYVPNSVKSIGEYAFDECSALTSVTIGNGLKSIGSSAFSNCNALSSVHITDLTAWCNIFFADENSQPLSLAHHLFMNNEEIKDLVIPDNVTTINDYAFRDCSELNSVTIPNSVSSIRAAFGRCSNITSLTLDCEIIKGWFSSSKSNIQTITFGEHVKSIGSEAFKNYTGITALNIPNNITNIETDAFYGCTNLTSVSIPNSVVSIGSRAFYGCSNIESLNLDCDSIGCWFTSGNVVTLGKNVRVIGSGAFKNFTGLTSITIPYGLINICSEAFQNCTRLSSVSIGNTVKAIGENAFSGCTRLSSVSIGNSVETICDNAFWGCVALKSIIIPRSVMYIGSNAFAKCDLSEISLVPAPGMTFGTAALGMGTQSLCNVNITDLSEWLKLKFPDMEASPACHGANLIVNGEKLEDLVIPTTVDSIGDYVLSNVNLSTVTIPPTVKHFGKGFWGVTYLTDNLLSDMKWIESHITDPEVINSSYPSTYNSILIYIPAGTRDIYSTAKGWSSKDLREIGSVWSDVDIVTINNATPGELQFEVVMTGLDEITNLKLTGYLNIEDVGYIRSQIGALANLKQVDLSEVQMVYDEQKSIQGDGSGLHYLSDRDSIIYRWVYNPLTGGDVVYDTYTTLGCMFYKSTVERVILPNGMTRIPPYAFTRSNIQEVRSNEPITAIKPYSFDGCKQLTEIDLSHVTEIGERAFLGCSGLRGSLIINGFQTLGSFAFAGCVGLTAIQFGEGHTIIPASAFAGCTNLKSVLFPPSLKEIGSSAFEDCNLQSITLPEGLKTLHGWAFWNCKALTDVTVPSSLLYVESNAFDGTPFKEALPIVDGVKYVGNVALTYDKDYFTNPATLSFREGTTGIANGFMRDNAKKDNVIAVEFPNTLRYIGGGAFDNGIGAKSITIPESVDSIGKYCESGSIMQVNAFAHNKSLNNVNYNVAGIRIGNDTPLFMGCANIERITVGAKVKVLPAFSDLSNLVLVNFQERTDDTPLKLSRLEFENCINLRRCNLPDCVVSIDSCAFSGCSSLTSFTIPESVKSIGNKAFFNCSGLTSVTIPNSVTSIGNTAFYRCSSLTSITIPNSVDIGYSAFWNCSGLTSVNLLGNEINIGVDAFLGCSNLATVNIRGNVPIIGNSAFKDCSSLTSFNISGYVTDIGENTFFNCTGLRSISFHNLKTLGGGAFTNCSNLMDFYCYANEVPNASSSAFSSAYVNRKTLHVPATALESYKTTSPWSGFGTIVALDEEVIAKGDLNGDGMVSITDVVLIIDVIAGTITDANQITAADVNNDGSVTITDCVVAIDLIAAQSSTSNSTMKKTCAMLTDTDFISATMQGNLLTIGLDNRKKYTAFQMVLNVPECITLGEVTMDKTRGADLQHVVRNLGNGKYLVAAFSPDNEELATGNGSLFSVIIDGQTEDDIVISNIEFVTTQAEAYRLADIVISNTPTGVQSIITQNAGLFFDLQGRRVKKPTKGIYLVNKKKTYIK